MDTLRSKLIIGDLLIHTKEERDNMDVFEELTKIKKLLDSGVITDEEFNQLKKQLLEEYSKVSSKTEKVTNNKSLPSNTITSNEVEVSTEGASVGMQILSFLIPIVGLILFLSDREKKPKAAEEELLFAGMGFVLGFIFVLAL